MIFSTSDVQALKDVLQLFIAFVLFISACTLYNVSLLLSKVLGQSYKYSRGLLCVSRISCMTSNKLSLHDNLNAPNSKGPSILVSSFIQYDRASSWLPFRFSRCAPGKKALICLRELRLFISTYPCT
uniref:Uncharacterized protein Rep n=1 Tax=Banana bunchy top virus TaxID=12585 RepID=Q9YRB8_BBTV|nr:unknown [Banana bunchy top virus]